MMGGERLDIPDGNDQSTATPKIYSIFYRIRVSEKWPRGAPPPAPRTLTLRASSLPRSAGDATVEAVAGPSRCRALPRNAAFDGANFTSIRARLTYRSGQF